MKRRLFIVLMLALASMLLVGCDLFGGKDTTTTTTQATTQTGTYYTVVFYDYDDTILKTQQVLEGQSATAPTNPVKPSDAQYTYTFNNWDTVFTNVTSDLHVRPVYSTSLNMYTVNFYNSDGTLISTQTVTYGNGATAPANPTRPADAQYTYTFTGWDVTFSNITSNLDVTAQYSTVTNTYTVTFYDEDGTTVLGTSTVPYGTAATAPANPSKPADAQHTYIFTGWSLDFSNVIANMSVIAQYTASDVEYTVTFYDEDGTTVLGTSQVLYGQDATAPTNPTKPATQEFTYTFFGWSQAYTNVTANIDVLAVYTTTTNQYTVTFYDEDGTTVLGTSTVDYGTAAIAPADPFKASDAVNAYSFDGWSGAFDTVVSDMSVQATYLTVPLGQTYEVNFYDAMGNIIDSQMIAHGNPAVAPAAPQKAADAQYVYTFSGWSEYFANVTSNLDIYPVFDTDDVLYTVTFYDYDETTVLWTGQVPFGASVTPPTSPDKPDDLEFTYLFIGWDSTLTYVMGNMDVYPTYLAQPIGGVFNRQLLVNLVNMLFQPDDVEAQIDELELITGAQSEEELFNMLTDGFMLFEQLILVDSAADLQNWYSATKTLGFDKTRIITMLYNAMKMGMTNDLNRANEDITYYTNEIANHNQLLSYVNQVILNFDNEVAAYCLLQVGLEQDCQAYWDDMKTVLDLEQQYHQARDQISWDNEMFNWYVLDQLNYLANAILEATYNNGDQNAIDDANNDYDMYWITLSPDEQSLYQPLMDMYFYFQDMRWELNSDSRNSLDVIDTNGLISIRSHLSNLFWGNSWDYVEPDPYYYGYAYFTYEIQEQLWLIEMDQQWLEEAENEYDKMTVMVGYFANIANETEVMTLMGTAYDALDAMIPLIDEPMFEMIMQMIGPMMFNPEPNPQREEMFNPLDLLTAEKIVWAVTKLDSMMQAAYGTLDQADFDNGKLVLIGFLEGMLLAEGMTQQEVDAFLATVSTTFDKYVLHFHVIVGELHSFLESVDLVKAQTLIDFAMQTIQEFDISSDIDIAIKVSQAIDILIGDDSLDVSAILQILADVYFDVTTNLNPDPLTVTAIQTAIDIFVTDTLALIDEVKDYNPHYLSEANVETVLELIGRVKAIGMWFGQGFESVLDPLVYYDDYMFDDLVWRFFNEDPSIFSTVLMSVFETMDKESTYYRIRSLYQYGTAIFNFKSFADIQYWVANLESFGFVQSDIVSYAVNLLALITENQHDGSEWFNDQMAYYQSQIDMWQGDYNDALANMQPIDDGFNNELGLLDPSLQADAITFWVVSQQNMYNYQQYSGYRWELEWNMDVMYIDELETIIQDIYNAENPFDQTQYDLAVGAYIAFVNNHAGNDWYLRDLMEQFKESYYTYYSYDFENYQPILAIIQAEVLYYTIEIYVQDNIDQYIMFMNQAEQAMNEIAWVEEMMVEMEEGLWFVRMTYDLFNDPANLPLTEEVMNIVLDDLQNMITSMPADSFALIEKLVYMIFEMNKPEINYMDEPDNFVFNIPFTAEEIFDLSQDLSAFLKLRLQTVDPTEMAALEAYVLVVVTEYVQDMQLEPVDEAALITRINTLAVKYLGFADDALDEFTNLLDGLTVVKVQMIMDYVMAMSHGGMNIYQQVIKGAQVINQVYDPAQVDLDIIIAMLLEVYFDINYETYNPLDLDAVVLAWQTHLADVNGLIDIVELYDAGSIDPTTYSTIIELQQKVMYFRMMFNDPEDIINNPPTFTFSYEMLAQLVAEIFNEYDPNIVDAIILDLCSVFELGPTDFEDLYYILLGVGSVIQSMPSIESPTNILSIYKAIASLGYTNAEIAQFIMNGVMIFLYPELPNMYDISELEAELQNLQDQVQAHLDAILDEDLVVADEIALITHEDPATQDQMRMDAEALWEALKTRENSYAIYDQVLNNYAWERWGFSWDIWNSIAEAYDNNDMTYINNLMANMDYEEYDMYQDILNQYMEYKFREAEADALYGNFGMYGLMLSTDEFMPLEMWLSNQASELMWRYMEICWLDNEMGRVAWDIQKTEEMAWLPQTIEIFLSDPNNILSTEQVIVILLDQMDAWAQDPNVNAINSLPMIFNKGLEGLMGVDLSPELIRAGLLLSNLFSTIDASDEAVIQAWLLDLSEDFATTQSEDPGEVTIIQGYLANLINTYFTDLMDIPAAIGTFLQSMDAQKTQELIDQIKLMMMIDYNDPNANNLQVIIIASIIDTLIGDNSFDYVTIFHPIFGIIYDVNVIMGNPTGGDKQLLLDLFDTQYAFILQEAPIIAALDPATTNPVDLAYIQTFVDAIDTIIDNFVPLVGGELPPA